LGIGALPMKSNLLLFACPEMHISSGHRPILWAFGGKFKRELWIRQYGNETIPLRLLQRPQQNVLFARQ